MMIIIIKLKAKDEGSIISRSTKEAKRKNQYFKSVKATRDSEGGSEREDTTG